MDLLKNTFPDENVPNEKKKSFEFGQQYANAIWNKESQRLYKNQVQFKKNQLYADGKQPLEDCKKNIKKKYINEAFLSVNWDTRVTALKDHLPKIWNGVDMSEFSPAVYAIDPEAKEFKAARKNQKMELLYAKDFIQEMAQLNGGESPIPLDSIPNSKEQVEMEEDQAQPLESETSEEMVLNGIALENNFGNIQWRVFRDAIIDGLGVARQWTDPIEGIKSKYIPNDTFIHPDTIDPYFTDCRYFAHTELMTINEVRKIAKRNKVVVDDKELKKIVNFIDDTIDEQANIKVLYFTFKSFLKDVYKIKKKRENNRVSVLDRTSDEGTDKAYVPKNESDISQRVEDTYDTWFEGIMIIGGENKVIEYKRRENMPEYKGMLIAPYIAFAPRISENGYNSLVETAISKVDVLQELDWKIQHLRNQLRGKMVEIDQASLSKIPKGGGKFYEPKEIFEFFFTLGITFRNTTDMDGERINNELPMREIPSTPNHDLVTLAQEFLREKTQLLEIFGYVGSDNSRPDDKTLYDTEPYRLSDNLALKDFSDGMFVFTTRCYQSMSSMLDNIFQWSDLKDKYTAMIGSDDMDVLEKYNKNRKKYYYENLIELRMTRQEKLELIQSLQVEQQAGLLTSADIFEIRNVKTIKQAQRMIHVRTEARKKQMQDYEQNKSDQNQNGNIQAIEASKQKSLELLDAEYKLKEQFARQEHIRKMELQYNEMQKASITSQDKKEWQKSMEELRQNIITQRDLQKKAIDRDTALEKQEQSNANQSWMIEQRKGQKPMLPRAQDIQGEAPQEVDLSTI